MLLPCLSVSAGLLLCVLCAAGTTRGGTALLFAVAARCLLHIAHSPKMSFVATLSDALLNLVPLLLVLLASAIPVALPVMFTVSMAIGSLELVSRGVLVSRCVSCVRAV